MINQLENKPKKYKKKTVFSCSPCNFVNHPGTWAASSITVNTVLKVYKSWYRSFVQLHISSKFCSAEATSQKRMVKKCLSEWNEHTVFDADSDAALTFFSKQSRFASEDIFPWLHLDAFSNTRKNTTQIIPKNHGLYMFIWKKTSKKHLDNPKNKRLFGKINNQLENKPRSI